jgi:transcriptional regulator of acetoin/glycerol metabolism
MSQETLAHLRSLTTLVNDRGEKHPARPLSAILLGQPRVPLVVAPYKSARQLTRSVRNLLEHALHRREQKAYVIGVPLTVFDQAAARTGASFEVAGSRPDSLDPMLIEPVDVPAQLERTLVGVSREVQIVRQWIVRAASHDHPVLILGETGTGKEVVARAIHHLNPGRERSHFQAVNCGAIPTHLFESEVFGYVRGAFTGAHPGGNAGMWRFAGGGTIFLDEIGDLAPHNQVKLLRVLEQQKIRPVGSTTEIPVDARVIAATNRDLDSMVDSGAFREDLFYRLASTIITLPPLRDRPEDVAALAMRFWADVAPRRPSLAEDVLQELRQYRWRGNARELRSVIVNLHTTFPKAIPTPAHVQAVLRMRAPREAADGGNGTEAALRRVEYLRHLHRVKAAIDACLRMARTLTRQSLDASRRNRLAAEVDGWLTELQLLGTRPERFDNVATFETTHRLAGRLAAFKNLLERGDPDALRYGKTELKDEASVASAAVRREEERILRLL